MNKSTGFVISMVIFSIGVLAVVASMVLGGFEQINVAVAVCQGVTILCMVGLLTIKLGKAEKLQEKEHEFIVEQDEEFIEADEGEFYSDDTNEEYIVHGSVFSKLQEEEPAEEEETKSEEQESKEPTIGASFEDEELDLEIPDFDEKEEDLQTELFEQEEKFAEPESQLFPVTEAEEQSVAEEEIDARQQEEVEGEEVIEIEESTEAEEVVETEDELILDMDPIIEQVFASETELEEEFTVNDPVKKTVLKVVGVRRIKNYSGRMPKKIKLKR